MNDNITEIINLLKLEKYKIKGNEIWTLCLNREHQDKHIGNFSINLDNGQFFCFACGFHGNIIYLLAGKGIKYGHAISIWNRIRQYKDVYIPAMPVDKYIIAGYKHNGISKYALERVGDKQILEEYDVYSDENDNPIFLTKDYRGKYNSVWVRENDRYFLIEPLSAKKDGVIYGEHLSPTDKTVLTEGPFDAMAVRKYTGLRGICGFGTYLSLAQINRLILLGDLIIMMDGDYSGRKARDILLKALESAQNKYPNIHQNVYLAGGYRNDPDELGSEISQIFSKLKSSLTYRMDKLQQNGS